MAPPRVSLLVQLLLFAVGARPMTVSAGYVQQPSSREAQHDKAAAPSDGGPPSDSAPPATTLFQITLNIDDGVQDVFRVYEGEDPLEAAAAKAAELSLNGEQTEALLEAAKQYGQRARVLPVAELPVQLPGGHGDAAASAAVKVFEGDSAEVLRQKILDAGVPEEQADSSLLDVLLRLQKLRVIPVTTAAVGEGDAAVQIPIYYLDDVARLAEEFASERGLGGPALQELKDMLRDVAVRHRAIPIVRVNVSVEGRDAGEEFMLFHGEAVRESVLKYAARTGNAGNSDLEARLMTHAAKLAAQGSYLPYYKGKPQLFQNDQAAQEKVPELAVFARDNAVEVVRSYAEGQRMSEAQRGELLAEVVRSGQRAGVIPLLSMSVNVLQPSTAEGEQEDASSDTAVPVNFELFEGEDLGLAVERFCKKYSLDEEGCVQLRDRVTLLAQSKRLLPVLTVPLESVTAAGDAVGFRVTLFDGEDPARVAREASEAAGLGSREAEEAVRSVRRAAVQARLIPALQLKLEDEAEERVFELWYGDNVTARVEEYSRQVGLSRRNTELLLENAKRQAVEKRLTPLLSVPVSVRTGETLEQQRVEVFEGDSIDAEVAAFARRFDLNEEGHRQVRELVMREAKVSGFVPLLTVAVNFPSTPGVQGNLSVFYGDSVDDAVLRFVEQLGLSATLPDNVRDELRELVDWEGVRQRVFPRYKAVHEAGGKRFAVELFEGDDVSFVTSRLAARAQLSDEDALLLDKNVKLAASRARAMPALNIPVMLEDGSEAAIRLYFGDDIAKTVADFGREHGLDSEAVKMVLSDVQRRAEVAKLVPLLSVPVVIKDGRPPVELQLYEGDNLKQAVSIFVKQHGIPDREDELERILLDASHERRVLPIHEVPVDLLQSNGTSRSSMFYLFKGERLADAAAAFAEKHGLPPESVPDLVTFLQGEIRKQPSATAAAAETATVEPLLTVPVQVGDGSLETLRLFRGDNIGEVLSSFGMEHGLDANAMKPLATEVQRRAEAARLLPLVSVPVEQAGGEALQLSLFEGDTVSKAVSAFLDLHGLPNARQPELERKLSFAGRERGVIPLYEVPVNVRQGDGSAADIMFHLFKGEKVEDAAVAFLDEHRLPESVLPDLLSLVETAIGAQGRTAPSPVTHGGDDSLPRADEL